MKRRQSSEYPKRDLMPEHSARHPSNSATAHPEVAAAYRYVESVRDTADFPNYLAWHGWALREAFLAGITYGQAQTADKARLWDAINAVWKYPGRSLEDVLIQYAKEQTIRSKTPNVAGNAPPSGGRR